MFVKFPPEFIAIRYPGYFFNIQDKRLYSAKSGVLKPLQRKAACVWNHGHAGYNISHKGKQRTVREEWLFELEHKVSKFPTEYYGQKNKKGIE